MGIVEAGSGVCPVIWAVGESTVSGSESAKKSANSPAAPLERGRESQATTQRFLADVRRPEGRCGEADFIPTPNVANTGTNGDWPGFTKETALTK
jgi:hypothetical protein